MRAAAVLVVVSCVVARSARADDAPASAPSQQAALAEELFVRAKALMADQRYDEACPMLAESQRLDPGGGTLLTLGLCHERQGRTATAWAELKEAHAQALVQGDTDRQVVSASHVAALEPKLSRLVVDGARSRAAARDLVVKIDGIVLGRPSWGVAAPIDPGQHVVEASALGKRSWSSTLVVRPDGDVVHIDVPLLADEAPPGAPGPRLEARAHRSPARTYVGGALLGVGAASLFVGAFYGVRAITKQSQANAACPDTGCSDDAALDANASARSAAIVADIAIPLGLLSAGIGAALLITNTSKARAGVRAPSFGVGLGGPGAIGAAARASF